MKTLMYNCIKYFSFLYTIVPCIFMCFICKLTFELVILLIEVLNYVQTGDARVGVCSPHKLVSHTSCVFLFLGEAVSSRAEVEVSSLGILCKKLRSIVGLFICTRQFLPLSVH